MYLCDWEDRYLKTFFRTFLALAVVSEVALLILARMSGGVSFLCFLVPVVFLVIALLVLFISMWKDYRHYDSSWAVSLSETAGTFGVPRQALALLVSEVGTLTAAVGVLRVPRVSQQCTRSYSTHRNLRTVVAVIVGLSVVEISVVHLAVPNGFWHYLVLAVSIYAVILLCGFYSAMRSRPHLVTSEGITIRSGKRLTCNVPWGQVKSVRSTRAGQGGSISIDHNGSLRVPVLSEVNVSIEVEPEVVVEDLHKGLLLASTIDFYCDDRDTFLEDCAAHDAFRY